MRSFVSVTFASVLALTIGSAGHSAMAQSNNTPAMEPAPGSAPGPGQGYAQYPAPAPAPYYPSGPAPYAEAGPGPERQAVDAPPPPPPASAPAPLMPREVIEAASAYATFINQAAAIDARFADGDAINAAMNTAASYQPDQLAEGAVAYAALIALQDTGYVEGVRRAGRTPEYADSLVRMLETNPAKAASIEGADEAAARINAVLVDQAERVTATGAKIRQAAYDMQRDAWTRQMAPDGPARLARAKTLSSSPIRPSADDIGRLFQIAAALRDQAGSAPRTAPSYTPVVQRGLALAALALVGRAGREELDATGLIKVRDSAGCMQMAKLNLYECLAVAGPHYENVYCLGEHALKDTGQCLREGAGAPAALAAPIASTALPAANRDAYAVPVADATPTADAVPVADAAPNSR
ncbi:MAG TPA: hypothetical protein VGI79_04640 [Caulobacteraceae bacterium]